MKVSFSYSAPSAELLSLEFEKSVLSEPLDLEKSTTEDLDYEDLPA